MTFSMALSKFFYTSIFPIVISLLLMGLWLYAQGDQVFYEGDSIKIQQRERIITIVGNAFIRTGTQGLKADKIIWYQNQEYAEAFNRVSFLDREQGVLYKGNYVKFLINKDAVEVKENPSIENRKDKIIIYADLFLANTKSGSIKARGNTRMEIRNDPENPTDTTSKDADYSTADNSIVLIGKATLKTAEQWLSADTIRMDQDKNFLVLTKNVRIEDSPAQKKKVKKQQAKNQNQSADLNSMGDSVLTCERANIFTKTKFLECFDNVLLDNPEDSSKLRSEYLLFDNPQEEITSKGKVSYRQITSTNEREVLADFMKIYRKQEKMYFTNEVYFLDVTRSGRVATTVSSTNIELDCYSMTYDYSGQRNIECFKDVVIRKADENSYVYSDYMFYYLDREEGYVTQTPYYLNQQGDNDLYFYSDKIDLNQRTKKVILNNDVLIVETKRGLQTTNSTITCKRGELTYQTTSSNDVFKCFNNVDVYVVENNTHFYGDLLTYYLQKKFSRLDANGRVQFKYQKNATNVILGNAHYMENFHEDGYSYLYGQVFINEHMNNQPINKLETRKVKYTFLDEANVFEGYDDVVFENLENSSTLYSDYLYYDLNTDQGWAKGSPVLANREEGEQVLNLVYADRIEIDNASNISRLKTNVYVLKTTRIFNTPPRVPKISTNQNYLNCQDSTYFFTNDIRMFECTDSVHVVDRGNLIDIYSDYMIYDIDKDYGFLKDKPYLINNSRTNGPIYVYSDTMEFFREQNLSLFHTNVYMEEISATNNAITASIECDDAKYNFEETVNIFECFENVQVEDYVSFYTITGKYLRHQVVDSYSYVSENAKIVWNEDGDEESITEIFADLFENFNEENVMYAKGNVKVDDGEHTATSSLGLYEPEIKRFTLFGSPVVRDRQGSEYNSEKVFLDLETRKLEFDKQVRGAFIPQDLIDDSN